MSCYFLLNVVKTSARTEYIFLSIMNLLFSFECCSGWSTRPETPRHTLSCYFLLNVVPPPRRASCRRPPRVSCYFLLNVVKVDKVDPDMVLALLHLLFSFECCLLELLDRLLNAFYTALLFSFECCFSPFPSSFSTLFLSFLLFSFECCHK